MGRRREPQQSTLSVRISPSLRDYVERARAALANEQGERLSLSEVAKVLLEEAQRGPLDERLQVSSLLLDPHPEPCSRFAPSGSGRQSLHRPNGWCWRAIWKWPVKERRRRPRCRKGSHFWNC